MGSLRTHLIRDAITREGSFLVNYANIEGADSFRMVASNPQTTIGDLEALLQRIEA